MAEVRLLLLLGTLAAARDAGVLYEVWHTPSALAMQRVIAQGGRPLTVETVIRSNGTSTLDDILKPYNVTGEFYHIQPAELGFYCMYRHRDGDLAPPSPDCPNITQTATRHAKLLSDAGFDYVAVDITNWPVNNTVTDVTVVRPTEVLFEEWLALRQQGVVTPQIAVWPCSPNGSDTWQVLLDRIYNNASYSDLIYSQDGKYVVFLPDNTHCVDADVQAKIEANGGRHNIKTIQMWALFGNASYSQGSWGFFSPCTSPANSSVFTTSMINDDACNQYVSINSTGQVGEVSASASYMVAEAALPFSAPGHMRGLTLQRLFRKVLAQSAPHLFISSFNELIGGRQVPWTHSNLNYNMGLPHDPQRNAGVWEDTYAAEFSRDFEPSLEAGDRIYQVMKSCVLLYKAGQTCEQAPAELCCTTADKQVFGNIWSLTLADHGVLLTNSTSERTDLVTQGWHDVCHPIVGPSDFCVNVSLHDGRRGPFILYNQAVEQSAVLYRCLQAKPAFYTISTQMDCDGLGTMENTLGYIATQRSSEMPRGLYRCQEDGAAFAHSLDLDCDGSGDLLGFVR